MKFIMLMFFEAVGFLSSASEKPTTVTEVIVEHIMGNIAFSLGKLQPDNEQFAQCLLNLDRERLHKKIKASVDKELSNEEQQFAQNYFNSVTYNKVDRAHQIFAAQTFNDLNTHIDMDLFVESLTPDERSQFKLFNDSDASRSILKISGDFSLIEPILQEQYQRCGGQ